MKISGRSHLCAVNILATANCGLTGLLRTFRVRRERVQTEFQNIFGGIQIAIHFVAAIANHLSLISRHAMGLTAPATHLAAGGKSVYHHDGVTA